MKTDDLIQRLVADARPVNPLPPAGVRWLRWTLAVLAVFVPAALLLGLREDLGNAMARTDFVSRLIVLAASGSLAAAGALALSIPGAERSRAQRVAPIVLAASWPLFLAFGAPVSGTSAAAGSPPGLCAGIIAGLAAGPAWLMLRMVRAASPLARRWTSALAVLAAAAWAGLVQQLHCPIDSMGHQLFEHAGTMLVMTTTAAVLGFRLVPDASVRVPDAGFTSRTS